MKPAAVDYAKPRNLQEALELLARPDLETRVIAGGQSLVAMMNLRVTSPGLLVDIARHAARAYARESDYTEEDALERIVEMFEAEIARPTDTGTTTPRSQQGH